MSAKVLLLMLLPLCRWKRTNRLTHKPSELLGMWDVRGGKIYTRVKNDNQSIVTGLCEFIYCNCVTPQKKNTHTGNIDKTANKCKLTGACLCMIMGITLHTTVPLFPVEGQKQ